MLTLSLLAWLSSAALAQVAENDPILPWDSVSTEGLIGTEEDDNLVVQATHARLDQIGDWEELGKMNRKELRCMYRLTQVVEQALSSPRHASFLHDLKIRGIRIELMNVSRSHNKGDKDFTYGLHFEELRNEMTVFVVRGLYTAKGKCVLPASGAFESTFAEVRDLTLSRDYTNTLSSITRSYKAYKKRRPKDLAPKKQD